MITTPVKEKVEAKLRGDSRTKDFPIEVLNSNGVIILQGEVPSEATSMVAEGLARQVEGVVNVMNELNIRQTSERYLAVPQAPGAPRTAGIYPPDHKNQAGT